MTHFVIIGLGSIGRRHARNLAVLQPNSRFTFVRRIAETDELSEALAADVVTDLGDIDGDVDLAVVATPSADHAVVLPELINRAWPLFVEKPIVSEVLDCDRIESILDDAPPALRVAGFNLRYLPSLLRLRRELATVGVGRLARASLVAGQWLPDWRPDADYLDSYSAHASRGGGVELDLSHEFDIARWLFGELSVVAARGDKRTELGLDSNDTSISVLAPASGDGPTITISLDYVSRRPVRRYDIVGDDASLTWSLDGTLDRIERDGIVSLPASHGDFALSETYSSMMRSTLDGASTGNGQHVQSLRDGLASSRLAATVRDLGSHA